jgi:GxxExxY protein
MPATRDTPVMIHRRDAESAEDAERNNSRGLTHAVIGSAIEVHRLLGAGLLEEIYEASLCRELYLRGLAFRRQVRYPIGYKGVEIGSGLRLDLLVEDTLVVEVKSVDHLASIHRSQLLTYLKLTGLRLGLLINFNVTTLRSGIKRVIMS